MTELKKEAVLESSRRMLSDLAMICDCGGRLAGTESERGATALLEKLGAEATGTACQSQTVPYIGWRATKAVLSGPDGKSLACHPLVRASPTPPAGLEAEVLDLGRGTPDEFAAHASEIPGKIVLVRHELMFAAGTIHRRIKYQAAVAAGAVGFLICGPVSGSPVAGSSGRGSEQGIPAMGISQEAAAMLARTWKGRPVARMMLESTEAPATARNLIFDMPGQADEWVVLSAHIDGHDLAQSAIDNASGLVVALAVARDLAAAVKNRRRGLRLALFNVEEWALTGSSHYVDELSLRQRDSIALNANLDSVGIDAKLTALTSGFPNIEPFLLSQSEQAGVPLGLYRPLQMNSDHANFAVAGIPAFRLVAGFNDVAARTRLVLTAEDTREKVTEDALSDAFRLTRQIVAQALDASPEEAVAWRQQ
jgi:Zn-dependent M28 family amino/carboxypeptidase